MWVTRVIATKIRWRPNTSATIPSTRGWLVSERIATTRSRTLPTWSPWGSKMGRPTSLAAYTRPGLAGPDWAVLTAGHATGRSTRSAVEILGAGRAGTVDVLLGHPAQLLLLRLVPRILDQVVVLPGVHGEPVELTATRPSLHPGPRPVHDPCVEGPSAATHGVALDRDRPGLRPGHEPRHDVDAVDLTRGRGSGQRGEGRRPVGVGDRGPAHLAVREPRPSDVHGDAHDVAEVPELAVEVVLAQDEPVVGGEHDVGPVQLVGLAQGPEGPPERAVHRLQRLDPLVAGDPQLVAAERRPRRVGAPDDHLVRRVLLEHVGRLLQFQRGEGACV